MGARRYLIVLNPKAGRGRALRLWPQLERTLRAHALPYELFVSAHPSDSLARVRALPPQTAVVAFGGDGTVRSLLPALAFSGRPLGLIPAGRGNDLAGALGWPPSLAGAVARLGAPPAALDVLEVQLESGAHYCLNGLGMGFDAQVGARAERTPPLGGFGQYALGALWALRDLRAEALEVHLDGALAFAGESVLAAVMNGTRYGGGFRISPLGRPDDAVAEVLCGRRVSRPELLALMLRVLRGRHLGHPKVVHGAGRAVSLRWAAPVHLHLDGDLFASTAALDAELLAGAVELLGGQPLGSARWG